MRVRFLNEPELIPLEEDNFKLGNDFNVEVEMETGYKLKFSVPKGFVTDLASVPRVIPIAYALFKLRVVRSAILHDYLIRSEKVDRALADKIFLEAMKEEKLNPLLRFSMWLGVRIGSLLGMKRDYEIS